jgi:arylsulfatase A-like enzyme
MFEILPWKYYLIPNHFRMKYILILLFICFGFCLPSWSQKVKSPNIILIFLDDMGYADLSVTGALQYQTPSIDKLAGEGIRFTNFLSAQGVCSASRAGLLTGCYPNRIGINGALFPNSKIGIHSNETTLAELLKQKGYATAIVGKWHLGDAKEFLPLQHGFDEYFGIPYSNDMWPVDYDGNPATDWRKESFPPLYIFEGNEKKIPVNTLDDQALLTKQYTDRAVDFIKRKKDKPFFLYLPHSMPHVPINASAQFKGKSKQGLYGDVMMEIDWSVNEILKAVKSTGIEKNTLIIFTSDNGPWLNYGNHAGSAGGFREAKGSSFEGGVRVPCIVRWPGQIQGGQISNSLSSTIDWLPTIAELVGITLPTNKIDGVSLLPILKGDIAAQPRREFYYYYRQNNLEAVRLDDWKLVLPHDGRTYENFDAGVNGHPGKVNENFAIKGGLYDLRRDPGERYDLQNQFPDIVKQLQVLVDKAREDLGDNSVKAEGKNRREVGRIKE